MLKGRSCVAGGTEPLLAMHVGNTDWLLQEGAMRAQWQLKTNMNAEFARVDPKHMEVAQLVPRASDRALVVQLRGQDATTSSSIAHVVLEHVEGLGDVMLQRFPGTAVQKCIHVHDEGPLTKL